MKLRGKGPQKPECAYNIVRIHSFMLYTHLIEYNTVGETKAPLLRCFPSISKLKLADIITTGQYMNYQTFSNLVFKALLKNSSHSNHIDLRDTSGGKTDLVSVGITGLVLMFRKAFSFHLEPHRRYKMVASRQEEIPFHRGIGRQRTDLEFAAPEIAEIISGRKIFKTGAKSVGTTTLGKQLGSCSRIRTGSRVIPTKSAKKTKRPRRDIFLIQQ